RIAGPADAREHARDRPAPVGHERERVGLGVELAAFGPAPLRGGERGEELGKLLPVGGEDGDGLPAGGLREDAHACYFIAPMRSLFCVLLLAFSTAPFALEEVPFVTTPDNVTRAMLDLARVGRDDFVIDLGSGDGR